VLLLLRIVVNAVALIVVALLVPGVHVGSFFGAVVSALVLGVVNAVIKPVLVLLALPLEILTIGLFTFVINAALFYFVGRLGIGLTVDGFGAAFIGAIVLSIVSWVLSSFLNAAERA